MSAQKYHSVKKQKPSLRRFFCVIFFNSENLLRQNFQKLPSETLKVAFAVNTCTKRR